MQALWENAFWVKCVKNVNNVMQMATLCELFLESKHFTSTSRPSQYLRAPHLTDGM